MDAGGLVVLGLMWLVLNALRKGSAKPGGPAKRGTGRRPAAHPPAARAGPAPRAPGLDATQREGARLQDLLQELGRTLDQTAGARGRLPDPRLPSSEDVDERAERQTVDHDDEAEAVIARRLAVAKAHAEPLGAADYQAFEARIHQEPADATAPHGYTAARLRDAVIWREILGPPVSLREEPWRYD